MKYLITTVLFFMVVFLVRIIIPKWRFEKKADMALNIYNMILEVIATAEQYGEHVSIGEVELQYNWFHKICSNLPEAYAELEKLCADALQYYQSLSTIIRSKNLYIREIYALVSIKNIANANAKTEGT